MGRAIRGWIIAPDFVRTNIHHLNEAFSAGFCGGAAAN
jgi:hypothetical protein